jgi:hypothetical protein
MKAVVGQSSPFAIPIPPLSTSFPKTIMRGGRETGLQIGDQITSLHATMVATKRCPPRGYNHVVVPPWLTDLYMCGCCRHWWWLVGHRWSQGCRSSPCCVCGLQLLWPYLPWWWRRGAIEAKAYAACYGRQQWRLRAPLTSMEVLSWLLTPLRITGENLIQLWVGVGGYFSFAFSLEHRLGDDRWRSFDLLHGSLIAASWICWHL